MEKKTAIAAAAVAGLIIPFALSWLGGSDFERGPNLAGTSAVSLIMSVWLGWGVHFFWGKKP